MIKARGFFRVERKRRFRNWRIGWNPPSDPLKNTNVERDAKHDNAGTRKKGRGG